MEIKKKSVPWKDGKVISICLRDGRYVLAQMVKSPYMVFFNLFSEDNSWEGVTLSTDNVLFCHAVTRQWKAHSPIERIKGVEPLLNYELPTRWIHYFSYHFSKTSRFYPQIISILIYKL